MTDAGSLAWTAALPGKSGPNGGNGLPPVSVGGLAVFAYRNAVSAWKQAGGQRVWQRSYPEAAGSDSGQIGGLWAWHGELIVLLAPTFLGQRPAGMRVQALDPATGTVRWTADLGSGDLYNEQTISADGVLALLTETGASQGRGKLLAVSLSQGRLLWTRPYGKEEGTDGPDADGSVIIVAEHGTATAFDDRTGAQLWSHGRLTGNVGSLPGPDGPALLYALQEAAACRPVPRVFPVIAVDARTGAVRWRVAAGGPVDELTTAGGCRHRHVRRLPAPPWCTPTAAPPGRCRSWCPAAGSVAAGEPAGVQRQRSRRAPDRAPAGTWSGWSPGSWSTGKTRWSLPARRRQRASGPPRLRGASLIVIDNVRALTRAGYRRCSRSTGPPGRCCGRAEAARLPVETCADRQRRATRDRGRARQLRVPGPGPRRRLRAGGHGAGPLRYPPVPVRPAGRVIPLSAHAGRTLVACTHGERGSPGVRFLRAARGQGGQRQPHRRVHRRPDRRGHGPGAAARRRALVGPGELVKSLAGGRLHRRRAATAAEPGRAGRAEHPRWSRSAAYFATADAGHIPVMHDLYMAFWLGVRAGRRPAGRAGPAGRGAGAARGRTGSGPAFLPGTFIAEALGRLRAAAALQAGRGDLPGHRGRAVRPAGVAGHRARAGRVDSRGAAMLAWTAACAVAGCSSTARCSTPWSASTPAASTYPCPFAGATRLTGSSSRTAITPARISAPPANCIPVGTWCSRTQANPGREQHLGHRDEGAELGPRAAGPPRSR